MGQDNSLGCRLEYRHTEGEGHKSPYATPGGAGALQDSQDNQRESIWSIRLLSLTRYYVVFGILFAIVTGLYVWQGFATAEPNSHPVGILLEAMRLASSSIPWLVVFTFYLVEGMNVLSERYLRSRYAKGRQEGLQEGREEGLEEGEQKGREEEHQQWLAWNQRREAALREGRDFTEPPPSNPAKEDGK